MYSRGSSLTWTTPCLMVLIPWLLLSAEEPRGARITCTWTPCCTAVDRACSTAESFISSPSTSRVRCALLMSVLKALRALIGLTTRLGSLNWAVARSQVCLENGNDCLYVWWVGIYDIIFTIAEPAVAAVTTEGSARKIRSHDVGGRVIDD